MEGPSLKIATEEFEPFLGQKIRRSSGTAKLPALKGMKLEEARSWGKHFLLRFSAPRRELTLRVHFLMFGSYQINKPRENRVPKLLLEIGKEKIYFYSCAIKVLEEPLEQLYDWRVDLMSERWDERHAVKALKGLPRTMVCDALMDQLIFSGLGNIIKNEVLWNLHMHPETLVGDLDARARRALVKEAHRYSWQFYEWKKRNVLKRNWKIMRKKTCPRCQLPVQKRNTGKLNRVSWYCEGCQHLGSGSQYVRRAA